MDASEAFELERSWKHKQVFQTVSDIISGMGMGSGTRSWHGRGTVVTRGKCNESNRIKFAWCTQQAPSLRREQSTMQAHVMYHTTCFPGPALPCSVLLTQKYRRINQGINQGINSACRVG